MTYSEHQRAQHTNVLVFSTYKSFSVIFSHLRFTSVFSLAHLTKTASPKQKRMRLLLGWSDAPKNVFDIIEFRICCGMTCPRDRAWLNQFIQLYRHFSLSSFGRMVEMGPLFYAVSETGQNELSYRAKYDFCDFLDHCCSLVSSFYVIRNPVNPPLLKEFVRFSVDPNFPLYFTSQNMILCIRILGRQDTWSWGNFGDTMESCRQGDWIQNSMRNPEWSAFFRRINRLDVSFESSHHDASNSIKTSGMRKKLKRKNEREKTPLDWLDWLDWYC